MNRAAFTLLLMLAILTGCHAGFQTRTYDITVENKSAQSVSAWLTKDGPVFESKWKAPEEWAVERPTSEPFGFQQIPPGKSADTGPVSGQFAPQTQAILRIYVGQHDFAEILAIGRRSPNRLEIPLKPGRNIVTLIDDAGRVRASVTTP
jgi:hypothetical protein